MQPRVEAAIATAGCLDNASTSTLLRVRRPLRLRSLLPRD